MTDRTASTDDAVISATEGSYVEPTTTQSQKEGTMTDTKRTEHSAFVVALDAEEPFIEEAGVRGDGSTPISRELSITYDGVIAAVDADPSLPESTKRELKSSVHRMAEIVSLSADRQTVDLWEINRRLNDTSPAMAGLSRQSYSNLRSRFRRALKIAGIPIHPGKQDNELTAEWAGLKQLLNDRRGWQSFSRLAHFASQQGWAPSEIADDHVERLVQVLREQALYAQPWTFHKKLVEAWNRCASRICAWPGKPLTMPSGRVPYTLDESQLPDSLRAEIDRCFQMFEHPPIRSIAEVAREAQAVSRRPSPFRSRALTVLAGSTIKHRRFQFLQFLSALVQVEAIRLDEMTSVEAVTRPALVEQGLLFFYKRAGNRMAVQIRGIALAIRSIVKHWLKDHARHAEIGLLLGETRGKRRMSARVADLLRQFDDPRNRAKLLQLPEELFREGRKLHKPNPQRAARLFEIALAIEILIFCPIRVGNLAALDIDKHLLRSRPGSKGLVHLVIPGEAVKNGVPIEFELLAELVKLIEEYITEFRIHLPGNASRWLFPRADGAHEIAHNLGNRIRTVIRRAGIRMTPHMFRHFGAESLLERMPAAHGIITTTLGHSSSDTAPRFYIRRKMAKAGKIYAENVLKLREEAHNVLRSRKRR